MLIAFLGGYKTEIDMRPVMLKRLHLTGSTLRGREVAYKTEIAEQLLKHVWPLLEGGHIKPVVSKVFPLARANEAHAYLESGDAYGKIILDVR